MSSTMAMVQPDNFKDSEAEPLLWTSSQNYGTETESSTISANEPTESTPKRQIGVMSVAFIIFNRLIGTG